VRGVATHEPECAAEAVPAEQLRASHRELNAVVRLRTTKEEKQKNKQKKQTRE
jgi:hypothetical protein